MTDEEKVDTSYRACMLLEAEALSTFQEAQAAPTTVGDADLQTIIL